MRVGNSGKQQKNLKFLHKISFGLCGMKNVA